MSKTEKKQCSGFLWENSGRLMSFIMHCGRKILALLCAVLLLCYPFGLIFSLNHNCTGENCLVCTLTETLKGMFAAIDVDFALVSVLALICGSAGLVGRSIFMRHDTLVLQKVMLLD